MKKFKSCLIVDDEVDLLEAMMLGLDFLFEKIDTAGNGLQALELLNIRKYDVIISDIQMPIMKGDELLKIVRGRGDNTPFIVVSGNGTKTQIEEVKKLGVTAFLEKPFQFEAFLKKVESVIENKE